MPKTPKAKKIVFLINPGAGSRAAAKARRLAPTLFPKPAWDAEFTDLKDWREIQPLTKAAVKAGAWAVVAVGGDGTLNQVAQALQGTTCRLGLIPAGTGNGYARALGLPLDVRGACAVIALGRVARLDFIAADAGRGYANMLGIGYDAWIAERANQLRWMNRFSGFLRYLAAGVQCLPRLRPQALRLTFDKGLIVEGRFLLVAVANSPQYGFGCTIAPDARMDDGSVDVVCMPSCGPWTFLRNCARLFKRKALVGAQFHRCKRLRIEALEGRPLAVHMDGEPGGTTPVEITVKPGALRTLVP
jgi:YegS/Rv2252/BmrU family lipid kinase